MTTEWIALLIALIAVIVGPAITIYVARRQIKAEVVLKNRKSWIDLLTDEIAAFHGALFKLTLLQKGKAGTEEVLEANLRLTRVKLIINPDDECHQQLCKLLEDAVTVAMKSSQENYSDDIEGKLAAIVKKSQNILKKEWEKIKKGR